MRYLLEIDTNNSTAIGLKQNELMKLEHEPWKICFNFYSLYHEIFVSYQCILSLYPIMFFISFTFFDLFFIL